MRIDLPGIGGSLGECVACGQSFTVEVITGNPIETLRMANFSRPLPVHSHCADQLMAIAEKHKGEPDGWKHLPEGPLRREFEEAVSATPTPERGQAESTGGEA